MPFPVISNRKLAPSLPTSTVWHEEKGRARLPTWTARNKVPIIASVCSSVVVGILILFVLHLLEERDLTVLCGRPVEDTLRASYPKTRESGDDLRSLENASDELASSYPEMVMEKGVGLRRARPKVLGVVGIQTGFDSGPRRKALRETWFPSTTEGLLSLEKATGLAFRFVIGHTSDSRKMRALEEEIATYKDFIRIDVDENYHKLTLKTLAFFKAVYMLFDADFYVKADDDIYLRPDRLATLLAKERPSPRTYLGCMKKGPVITDPGLKWYEPMWYMLGSEYFLHAYGPIYALSSEVVAGLSVARNDSYRMFTNEDVTIGVWMLAMDVTHEDDHALCETQCQDTSIAVWDLPKCSGLCNPTVRLLELHKDERCSKSPSLLVNG